MFSGTSRSIVTPPAPLSFSTNFDGTESPLSEGGVWTTGSPYQPICQKGSGVCWGNQTGDEKFVPTYNDSQAWLSGFKKNHACELTIQKLSDPVGDLEVELLLGARQVPLRRSSLGQSFNNDTDFDGIEINLGIGKYGILGFVSRYLEPNGNYDNIGAAFTSFGVQDGDKLRAQLTLDDGALTGNVIVWMIRGALVTQIANVTRPEYYQVGNPGIAFYRENNSPGQTDDPKIFSATSFSAWELP